MSKSENATTPLSTLTDSLAATAGAADVDFSTTPRMTFEWLLLLCRRQDAAEAAERSAHIELSRRLDAIEEWTTGGRVKVEEEDKPSPPPLPGREIADRETKTRYHFHAWLTSIIDNAILADRAACGRGVAAECGEVERG